MTTAPPPASSLSDEELARIAFCKVHPGLGIARVGNSPDEYFVGPESPGRLADNGGAFKDEQGRIKRQAARFRVYAYDANGEALCELTCADADIKWSVQLANCKASFDMFLGRYWQQQYPALEGQLPLRNQELSDPADRRLRLEIRPEARAIAGVNQQGDAYAMVGSFGPLPYTPVTSDTRENLKGSRTGFLNVPFEDPGDPDLYSELKERAEKYGWKPGELQQPVATSPAAQVYLGELRTDAHGRLLVLGGHGVSQSLVPENPIGYLNEDDYFANNDYWHDDTSDGPVAADVTLRDGRKLEVRGQSWVLVVPPKFAPQLEPLTTLYDVSLQIAEHKWPDRHPRGRVSFTRDVYPLLSRLGDLQWVNQFALAQHGSAMVFDPLAEPLFGQLHAKNDNPQSGNARRHLFSRVRKPLPVLQAEHPDLALEALLTSPFANEYANMKFMPQMYGDGGQAGTYLGPSSEIAGGLYVSWQTLSVRQYESLRRWAEGDFDDDWPADWNPAQPPPPPALDTLPVAQRPAALDRASLDPCIGAPFYPGIEITYICQDPELWSELGRLDAARLGPGDITRHMALPWQADFAECNHRWWPTQRPDEIVDEAQYSAIVKSYDPQLDQTLAQALAARVLWSRGLPPDSPGIDNAMVEGWSEMGFVVPREGPGGQQVEIETERDPFAGTDLRGAFYYLMNIALYPQFLPKARRLVDQFLEQARRNQRDPELVGPGSVWSPFPYTPEAFDARLEQIYNGYVQANSDAGQANSTLEQTTREQQVYRILQMAPFNQLDGTWIRGAAPPGTVSKVRSLLFQIYMDEMGDAVDSQNHSNVYTDLLKSLNIYLPEISSRDYANDSRLLDSAFVEPVFLLAISTFTEEYLPEILGMTLYLEWGSIGLISAVDTLEGLGIDPLYYRLHVGIDNAAAGHGAIAKQAVQLYLDEIREQGGEAVVQQMWQRIWDGYVAFGTLGSLAQDIADHFASEGQTPNDLQARMQAMISAKAEYARKNHREKMLGPNFINDWFDDPAGMLVALQDAGFVVPGKPELSPIFGLMSFTGPMYHVFTEDEQALWRDYILSLGPQPKDPAYDLEQALSYVVDVLRERQRGQPAHRVRLVGPDPHKPDQEALESIHWWFDLHLGSLRANDDALLGALRDPRNGWIVPGNASGSPMVTSMLAGNGAMATAFREVVPRTGGQTFKQVMATWIDRGCPVAGAVEPSLAAARPELRLMAGARPKVAAAPPQRRRRYGNGPVH